MISITSANIRFENPQDGPHDWPNRKDFLAEILNHQNLDLLGTQEGRQPQLRDLEFLLNELKLCDQNRDWIEERMYPCIFYNPKTIEVIDSGDIWLSQTPNIPGSSDFDSAFPRLATWIQGRDIESRQLFYFFNCHLDHVKEDTRIEQIRVLCDELLQLNKTNLPIIISGDFNTSPTGPVRKMIIKKLNYIVDPWIEFNKKEETSFHKFDGKDPTGESKRIDWILHSSTFHCDEINLIKDSRNGIFPSDHFFVQAKLDFSSKT
jgi:endonuclease/exonuclease/phosphatase family metal-dependent hydrolase